MRTMRISAIIFSAIFITGCTKDNNYGELPIPIPDHVKNLVGSGNRVWRLLEIYQNGVQTVLTGSQLKYTKTYTIDPAGGSIGRFTDYDGYGGTWKYNVPDELEEKITATSGSLTLQYRVLKIKKDTLDVSYIGPNNTTLREVYFGF